MREFARELSSIGEDTILSGPRRTTNSLSKEQREQWADLACRYPFLNWVHGAGVVLVRGGIVELTWGSPLTGHWGFQVSSDGKVKDAEEDRCVALRVSDDIQFINYYD